MGSSARFVDEDTHLDFSKVVATDGQVGYDVAGLLNKTGNVMIDPSATIGKNCKIGPNVTIGPNVVIGDGVRLQRCVLLQGSKVKEHAWIKSTIVGW